MRPTRLSQKVPNQVVRVVLLILTVAAVIVTIFHFWKQYSSFSQDGDGVPDEVDRCPNEAEDFDGFEDTDGCPDYDNDGDAIPDTSDGCPNAPETRNGKEDHDGCPD